MASKIETKENPVSSESLCKSSIGKEMEASTSNAASKSPRADIIKETKIIQSAKRKIEKVVSKTSNKKTKKCKNCKYYDFDAKLKKHEEYFCDKDNNKWWDIEVSGEFQHRIVKGDFGKALCRYKCQSDNFTFEIYTDMTTFELGKYKTAVQLRTLNKSTRKPNVLETEFEAEYDWKLTIKDWKKQDYGNKFQIKVNICLKPEVESNPAVENE